MSHEIKHFKFNRDGVEEIREYHLGTNWPVVYIINDEKYLYVGQATSAYRRARQHRNDDIKSALKDIHIITDFDYNLSATHDIESFLIQHMSADGKFSILNGNEGLVDHNYYSKESYKAKFETIWEDLRANSLVKNSLNYIRNSNFFKFSPYKSLTPDQEEKASTIVEALKKNDHKSYLINGKPGTGKTILAVYLCKLIMETKELSDFKIGFVVPMTSLRKTLKDVFKKVPGLKSGMILGPSDVLGGDFDLLIVDEAHRLRRRTNITNFMSFDQNNKKLGLDNSGTELDWIMRSSKSQILMYDPNQTVRPTDIRPESLSNYRFVPMYLETQKRVRGGDKYIKFVEDLLGGKSVHQHSFDDYDFKVFSSLNDMRSEIIRLDESDKIGLCRMVAGYAWDWRTKKSGASYDIKIGDLELVWNSVTTDWVNSPNSVNEIGCIHTIQGYDLNYTGVIIGPELSYDPVIHKFIVYKDKYKDINGRRSILNDAELERYILNIYKTLMTRGIMGTYLYIVDENLRKYFESKIPSRYFV